MSACTKVSCLRKTLLYRACLLIYAAGIEAFPNIFKTSVVEAGVGSINDMGGIVTGDDNTLISAGSVRARGGDKRRVT